MATVDLFESSIPYSTTLLDNLFLLDAMVIGPPSETDIVFQQSSFTYGYIVQFSGTGLLYDANNRPTSGTITAITLFDVDGTTILNATAGLNVDAATLFDKIDSLLNNFDVEAWLLNGDDTITGSNDPEEIFGYGGADTIDAAGGDDVVHGGSGADILDGGESADDLDILCYCDADGDPTALHGIVLDAVAGTVIDPWGSTDTISNFESYEGTLFADSFKGSSEDEVFAGSGGRDTIDGGGGFDTVSYYDDVLSAFVDVGVTVNLTTGVAIDGFGRQDTLKNIEAVDGTDFNDVLTGDKGANTLYGNDGDDVLNGGGGADTLVGGYGADIYFVDNAGDIIEECGCQSDLDQVRASRSYTLGTGVEVELLATNGTTGTSAINLTGNEVAQTIIGNAGANILDGGDGADRLRGLGGADTFAFSTALGPSNVDAIFDFDPVDDTIALDDAIFTAFAGRTSILPGHFRVNTTGLAHDASDHIIYDSNSGTLYYDADGKGGDAAVLFATIATGLALTSADFSIV